MVNNTFYWWEPEDELNMISQTTHTVLGYVGLVFNGIILFVMHNQGGQLLLSLLAVSDIGYNVKEICDSTYRLIAQVHTAAGKMDYHDTKVPRILCLMTPALHGAAITDAFTQPITAFIAVERCIAVFSPMWYNQNWDKKEREYAKRFILANTLSLLLLYIPYFYDPYLNVKATCTASKTSAVFSQYVDLCKLVLSVFAVIVTMFAVAKGKSLVKQYSATDTATKRMTALNRTAIVVTMINFVLVFIPESIDIARTYKWISVTAYQRSAITSLNIANSTVNFPVLLMTNKDFRDKTFRALMGRSNKTGPRTTATSRAVKTTATAGVAETVVN